MRVFHGDCLASFYSRAVQECITGQEINPRGLRCYELRPVTFYTEPKSYLKLLTSSGVSYRFAHAELMAVVNGWDDVAWLERFRPGYGQFSDDGVTLHGAYGKRFKDTQQLERAIARLSNEPYTRQIVLNIWNPLDLTYKSNDIPCNTQILLKVRPNPIGEDTLHMTVIRRSADIIWGVPYDHYVFGGLLYIIADCLRVQCGTLTEVIDSLHIYDGSANFYDNNRVNKALTAKRSARKSRRLERDQSRVSTADSARTRFYNWRSYYKTIRREVENEVVTL